MKENPLNHKYTKVEDRADLMFKEITKPGHIVEIGDIVQIIVLGKIIEATDLGETPEGMVHKITAMKGIVVAIEIGIGQGKELLQGIIVMVDIEVQAMLDLDQGPELVNIEIE